MLKMLEEDLRSKGAFTQEVPEVLNQAVKAIPTDASYKMKLMMAMTEIMVFTSQLRKPLMLEDGALVPINTITFIGEKTRTSATIHARPRNHSL